MELLKYLPLLILLFLLLKFLILFFQKLQNNINKTIESSFIKNGIVSIKDLQKNNHNRFLNIINFYLESNGFTNISIIDKNTVDTTYYTATLNKEIICIGCVQTDLSKNNELLEDTLSSINILNVEQLLAKMLSTDCKKGILITNTTFSEDCITFTKDFNHNLNNLEINLVDGYELTKSIRNYRNYFKKEVPCNE